MGKKYRHWKETVVNALEVPADLAWQDSILTLTGQTLCVENYRSILCYQPEYLCIQLKNGRMKIQGRNLQITRYTREEMQVTGWICQISLEH